MSEPWKTDSWWVSPFNYLQEVRAQMPDLPDRVLFHDATLRDGEQTPGVVFRREEKVRIATMLDEAGVDRIEVALPAVSAEDLEALRDVVALRPKAEVFAFCRAMKSDIDIASECGVDGIILEFPLGKPRLDYQFKKWSKDDVMKRMLDALNYASTKKFKVALFPMEATRAEPDFFDRFLESLTKNALPYSVVLADTTGCLIPQAAMYMVKRIKEVANTVVEVHTHSDFGLGVSTALAAVVAGAEVVHTSVGGLGERTGNTPLEEIAVSLKALLNIDVGIDFSKLTRLGREVADMAGIRFSLSKPVIGERTFTRESGMGIDFIKEYPLVLFALNPAFVGQEPQYVIGKKSGLASIHMKLKDLGLPAFSDEQTMDILNRVKAKGIQKKALLSDAEFRDIVSGIEKKA